LQASDLLHYFPEMRPLIGQCRFHNCTHRKEPDCAIKQAAADGKISPQRLDLLQRLSNELLNQTA
jgi:ribosome biogenesis GTPase